MGIDKKTLLNLVEQSLEENNTFKEIDHVCSLQKTLSTNKVLKYLEPIKKAYKDNIILIEGLKSMVEDSSVVYMKDKNGHPLRMGESFNYLDDKGVIINVEGVASIKWRDGEVMPVEAFYYEPVDKVLIEKVE